MTHPSEFSDTDARAMEVWLALQRRMTPGEKLACVLEGSRFVLRMYEAGVRLHHPGADEREIFLRTASRHLDRELMIRAYGWDPAAHENAG